MNGGNSRRRSSYTSNDSWSSSAQEVHDAAQTGRILRTSWQAGRTEVGLRATQGLPGRAIWSKPRRSGGQRHRPATIWASAKGGRRQLKKVGKILTLLSILLLESCEMGGYSTENPDDFCAQLLRQGYRDARDWLRESPEHTLGVMENQESLDFISAVYQLGAAGVYAVEIDPYAGSAENTGKMVLELPAEPASRAGVFKWAAKIAHEQGFDAYSDVGQRYIFLMLD